MGAALDNALKAIPDALRIPAVQLFDGILADYHRQNWEGLGTKAGKLCEVVYCILLGRVGPEYPAAPAKPDNFVDACRNLEKHNRAAGRSICIQIPKVLIAIYEMRNNRAIGHIHGEIDPNHMDGEFIFRSVKWIIAELVRVYQGVELTKAREIVEGITVRNISAIWEVDGDIRRVLNPKMSFRDQVLLLSYGTTEGVGVKDLLRWTEHSNPSVFRKTVLKKLHTERLIQFDSKNDVIRLSPLGQQEVEIRELLKI